MRSYKIAELSFGSSRWDHVTSFTAGDGSFELQRFGVEYSVDTLKRMIERLRGEVDAISLTSFPSEIRFRDRVYTHRQALDIMTTPTSIPLCNGERVRELTEIDGLVHLIREGSIFPRDGIFVPLALLHMEAVSLLRERFDARIGFGDVFAIFKQPLVAEPWPWLLELAKLGLGFAQLREMGDLAPSPRTVREQQALEKLIGAMRGYRYIYGDPSEIILFAMNAEVLGGGTDFVRGKEIITTTSDPRMLSELRRLGAAQIHRIFPANFEEWSPRLTHASADAVLRLLTGKSTPLSLEEWQEVLSARTEITQETKRWVMAARPSVQTRLAARAIGRRRKREVEREPDFAFVVHSLSYRDLTRAPGLKLMRKLPKTLQPKLERATSRLPGIVYGRASGIISQATGREVTGLIYGLFATPRVMKEDPPEVTYAKIEKLCHHAADHGAKIIGLGAYTKIVGDAGATINRMSPIPVTTGNSLSASATLWAVHDAVRKMRLLEVSPQSRRVRGTAMVIGATGSIGKVSAKLLSMVFERLVLIAPRLERLEELAQEIRQLAPSCEIRLSTQANDFAEESDVIVTATSAFDQKVVDIQRLKPGAVVCDCSRPLDFTLEDAIARPDVLFIESGEVELPGAEKQFDCDLGLPGKVVYACLGETALLALEERYEAFTLGRDLDWQRVKEIYKLATRHGVQLAAIRGPSGLISDREIQLCRDLALRRRQQAKSP